MNTKLMDLSIGLEEELFLVDIKTGELCKQWPDELVNICQKKFPEQIVREFLSGQVELVSSPANSLVKLNQELYKLRSFLIEQTARFGLAPMASSTHPFAKWQDQQPTDSPRYQRLADELKISAQRMLVCGTHIHIGIKDINKRLKLFNELNYFLPIILSLTSSSPFWGGQDTGLVSYRATILNGLPRGGLPPIFSSIEKYQNYLSKMVDSNAIESGRELWWDLRLSARFPTLELRIADGCTNLNDLIAVAALVQSLSSYLLSQPASTLEQLEEKLLCIRENRWRVQRYSINEAKLLIFGSNSLAPAKKVIGSLVETLTPYAEKLCCLESLNYCLTICQTGTSAVKQRKIYQQSINKGLSSDQAMLRVTKYLVNETANINNHSEHKTLC